MNTEAFARRVFLEEIRALENVAAKLDHQFVHACEDIIKCRGKIVITGVGKSGLIGQKIAATLRSIGIAAFFMHATEAAHGDFGLIKNGDIVMVISYSGMTIEVLTLLPLFKNLGVKIIAITGNRSSLLAESADHILDIGVDHEAGPFNLVPTSSTTAALVMGDAIAMVIMTANHVSEKDLMKLHPGGNSSKNPRKLHASASACAT